MNFDYRFNIKDSFLILGKHVLRCCGCFFSDFPLRAPADNDF